MKKVFIGLGSNLNNPQQQIITALIELRQLPKTTLLQTSSLYQTPPLGPCDQPDFINAVAEISTLLSPIRLLEELQTLEIRFGRERKQHWGPRTLDLDILLYGDEIIVSDMLTIPHPGLMSREFVLFPLQEIAPNLQLPTGETVSQLLAQCGKVAHKLNSTLTSSSSAKVINSI